MKTTHTHHIVPRHMGGSDDPSNLVELTVEEHAEAHRLLYEQHGHWEDLLAWKGLSGQSDSYEIQQEKRRLANLGNKHFEGKTHSDEYKEKLSDMMKHARTKSENFGHYVPHTDEEKEKISNALKGNKNKLGKRGYKLNDETRLKMSASKVGSNNPATRDDVKEKLKKAASKKLKCPYCDLEMNAGNLSRHIKKHNK